MLKSEEKEIIYLDQSAITLGGKRRELRPGLVVVKTGSKLINQFSFVENLTVSYEINPMDL